MSYGLPADVIYSCLATGQEFLRYIFAASDRIAGSKGETRKQKNTQLLFSKEWWVEEKEFDGRTSTYGWEYHADCRRRKEPRPGI